MPACPPNFATAHFGMGGSRILYRKSMWVCTREIIDSGLASPAQVK